MNNDDLKEQLHDDIYNLYMEHFIKNTKKYMALNPGISHYNNLSMDDKNAINAEFKQYFRNVFEQVMDNIGENIIGGFE